MSKELDIQLLVSYVSGNCSVDEQKAVEAWVNLSKDNEMLYADYQRIWNSTSVKKQSVLVDVDSRWEDFKKRSNFESAPVIKAEFSFKHFLIRASRVAAVIAVLFSVWMMFDVEKQAETVHYSANLVQDNTPYLLPDGSEVDLNTDAELSHPEYFASDIREVDFNGEAFFDVAHNPEKPLIIATDNVRVKVLGTSFNLCNHGESNEITVYLESGKILFYSVDPDTEEVLEQVILMPGEKAVYSKTSGLITKSTFTDNNHTAWKTGVLEFVNAPLCDVIKVIENTYRVNVNCNLAVGDYHLTARFENESKESIFESLQIIYGFDCKIDENSIAIQ